MKKIYLILLLLIAAISISVVSAADVNLIDDSTVSSEADDSVLQISSQDLDSQDVLGSESSSDGSSDLLKSTSNSFSTDTSSSSASSTPVAKLTSKNVVSKYGTKVKFKVKVKDSKGNKLANKLVTFKVNGVKYKIYSNSHGNANLKIALDAGTYKVKYSSEGISGSGKITFKNAYKITLYKWGYGVNVKKNSRIKANIPNSKLVKKMVKYAKKGVPVIKFKGGSGKVVFLTAGVHGNELSSQVAAMKMIKKLQSKPIKGTVYIMPFMNPKATAKNVRNYKINLNSYADTPGTLSYKTVQLIVKFKCDAYGDFHCTRPGGGPGKNVAMGIYNPTYASSTMAKYIAKKSNVNYLIYKTAGTEYPGALEDVVNLKGISAVTCEAVTPHGTIASGSVKISFSMMKSFLKFNGLL